MLVTEIVTVNWRALGLRALKGVSRLLLITVSILPMAPLGDRPGHVNSGEQPWAIAGAWLSSLFWISGAPLLVLLIATRTNPLFLFIEIPVLLAAAFWASRRFSASVGEEQTVAQWINGMRELFADPQREHDGDDLPAARGPLSWWRILAMMGLATIAVAAALSVAGTWTFVLPRGAGLVAQIAPFYPLIGLLGYWLALVVPSAVVGYRHGKLASGDANTNAIWGPQIAAAMGIPPATYLEYQCKISWSPAKDELTVSPVPPAARLKLDGLAARVEIILPGWSLKSADSEAISLVTLNNDAAEAASRQFRAQSNGMVIGIEQTGGPTSRWILNPDRRVDPAALDAFARTLSLRILSCDEYRYSATAGRLTPDTERVRDGLAALLRCAPHELDIRLTEANDQTNEVHIRRYPPVLDPEKRIATYLTAIRQLIPIAGAFWHVDDNPAAGSMTLSRRIDTISGVQMYPWDAEVTHTAIPFARDTAGEIVSLAVLEANGLMGGIPGSGKSGGLTSYLAGVSRLENVALIGLDPKKVELSPWSPRFTRISKTDEYASALLEALVTHMDLRYDYLEDRGLKKFTPAVLSAEWPLICVVVDELADLVGVGVSREERDAELQRSTSIRRLIAKGRAAGIVVVCATQKPSSEIVPTALRDLIQQRICFSTTTVDMTDTILGKGMGSNGGAAHEIEAAAKGVCYIVNETSRVPVRARAFWIPDEEVQGLAESTAHLRVELPWLPPAPVRAKPTPGFVIEPEPEVTTVGEFEFSLDDLDDVEPVAELKPAPVVSGGFTF